jgi:hypothetical protein
MLLYNRYMTNAQSLIQRLQRKGWTLAALSRELGVTTMTVYRWQRGSNVPENRVVVERVLGQLLAEPVPKRKYRRRGRSRSRHE